MNLLMITRKVDPNDALAGFSYNWVKAIGSNLDNLYVISWQKGDRGNLPENIKIVYLPNGKIRKFFVLQKELLKILPKVSGLFCHMNPEYTICSAFLAKVFRKRIVSWYTHRAVTFRRRLLERLADRIITASSLSFRDPKFPDKVRVIGHGIDTDLFCLGTGGDDTNDSFEIVSVGRISPTKDYESVIKAMGILNDQSIRFKIIGDVILSSQKSYLESLKLMAKTMNLSEQVEFVGWVANKDMAPYYQQADLFINMSGTGSVDKVVLEAMACGCLVLTANESFSEILPAELMVEKNNPQLLSEKIQYIRYMSAEDKSGLRSKLRQEVVENHNLINLAKKIISQFV